MLWKTVQPDQASGRSGGCMNCGVAVGSEHRAYCYAMHQKRQEMLVQQQRTKKKG